MNDPESDFTCVDGECHDFTISDKHPSKRGNLYVLEIFFFCRKCLKEMKNERKEASKEPPTWWKSEALVPSFPVKPIQSGAVKR